MFYRVGGSVNKQLRRHARTARCASGRAIAEGWLLAGREPSAIARRPLEQTIALIRLPSASLGLRPVATDKMDGQVDDLTNEGLEMDWETATTDEMLDHLERVIAQLQFRRKAASRQSAFGASDRSDPLLAPVLAFEPRAS